MATSVTHSMRDVRGLSASDIVEDNQQVVKIEYTTDNEDQAIEEDKTQKQ